MTKLDVFPTELKQLNQWICWKSVQREGSEKPSKVPCVPETGVSIDPSKQLYSHFEVCQYVEKYPENVSGIGFYFNGNGISGIDLDNCIDDTGNISEDARQIIDKINSYTELSPSGKGVHILFRGQLPAGSHNRKGGYEVYSDKRYFTMTGNVYENRNNLESRQEELEWFCKEFIQPKETSHYSQNTGESGGIINLIQKCGNADKFNRLMNGEISDYDNDDSAADAALMSILAFYCKKNPTLMEEVFNQSKLAKREKWIKRKDYREKTISFAIERTRSVFGASNNFDEPITFPSQDEQKENAKNILNQMGNPCGDFDTSTLPETVRKYVDHICAATDAPSIIVTTAFLGMVSGFLKKSVYIPEDDYKKKPYECYFERLYANVWCLNVLESGLFKTTALNKGFRLGYLNEERVKDEEIPIEPVLQSQEDNKELNLHFYDAIPRSIFLPQKTTGEALFENLKKLGGGVEVFSEFGVMLQDMEKNYNLGLKSTLTELFDVPKFYSTATKKEGTTKVERPYISIVGVSTLNWVRANVDISDVSTGFFSRFLIFNPPYKQITPPALPVRRPGIDHEIEEKIKNILFNKVPKKPREYALTEEAALLFQAIHLKLYGNFHKLPEQTKIILEPFIKRWSPYILKIAMILQFLIDPDTDKIGAEAIESAHAIVEYAIKSTIYLFQKELGESEYQTKSRRVLEFIAMRASHGKTAKRTDILSSKVLEGGKEEYDFILNNLIEIGSIIPIPAEKKSDIAYCINTGER